MLAFAFYLFSSLLIGSSLAVIFARNPVHSVLFLIFSFFNAAGLFILLGAEFIAMVLVIVYVGAVAVLFLFVVMMMNISTEDQKPMFTKALLEQGLKGVFQLIVYGGGFSSVMTVLVVGFPYFYKILDKSAVSYTLWEFYKVHPFFVLLPLGLGFFPAKFIGARLSRARFMDLLERGANNLLVLYGVGLLWIAFFALIALSWRQANVAEEMSNSPIPPLDLMTNTHALAQLLYTDYILAFQISGFVLLSAMVGAIVLTLRQREGVKRQNTAHQLARRKQDTLHLKKVPIGKGTS